MTLPRASTPHGLTRLVFGMVPVTDDDNSRVMLGDFCALLGRAIDTTVLPHRSPSPAALASAIHAGRVHLAWISPGLLVTSPHLNDVVPLASSVREGSTGYHAVLFVPDDSPITTTAQLAGKRVAWVAKSSAAGYLFPRIALARHGLDPRTLFAEESFHDSHGGVAHAVLEGRADVGATFAVYEHGDPSGALLRTGFSGVVPGRDGRVIDVTGPIPADVVVAAASVPIGQRSVITVGLQSLADNPVAGASLHSVFGVDRFRVFSAASFSELRALIAAGRENDGLIAHD